MIRIFLIATLTGTLCSGTRAEQPTTGAAAFDRYVAKAEDNIRQEEGSPNSFLSIPSPRRAAVEAELRRGQVLINRQGDTPIPIPGGLIHHWAGLVFIPGAAIAQVLGILQDYQCSACYYAPEVVSSKLFSRNGNDFRIALRLREHKIITIVLDTEYNVRYGQLDEDHQYSVSRSTHIAEIANAGEAGEHPLAPGDDHGFLRQLNTYWRFERTTDGVFVECEAISMTRDLPAGLDWLISPFIQSVPRDSLSFTLTATRKAVLQNRNRN